MKNQYSSINIVSRLWAEQLGFESWKGQGYFSLHHHIHTSSGANPACYSVGNGSSFPKSKVAGA